MCELMCVYEHNMYVSVCIYEVLRVARAFPPACSACQRLPRCVAVCVHGGF